MSEKKTMITIGWIVVAVLLTVWVGIIIAMLASGQEPSLHFIGSFVLTSLLVGLLIRANLIGKKAKRAIADEEAQGASLAAKKDFAAAIRIWKELLPQVGEQQVNELLPQIEHAYQEMGSSEGGTRLSELRKLYVDFFDMTRRMKQLDAKGRTMRQSLADRICETVGKLPES